MICADCKKEKATEVVLGVVEHHVCDKCYKRYIIDFPRLRKMEIRCSKCDAFMFVVDTDNISGPIATICDKCLTKDYNEEDYV